MNPNLSQTPYFIRALWEWCSDAGLSPQIVVHVDEHTRVPRGFVVDGRIVLDISAEATNQLELGDEWITFQARFGTKVENIEIPMGNVLAIFAALILLRFIWVQSIWRAIGVLRRWRG